MYSNYHTHTYLCRHASGTPKQYAEQAIKNRLKILGFSDHNPCRFKNGFVSGYRMDTYETETYVNEIKELRVTYSEKIKILIGYEAEYYPDEFSSMLKNIEKYGYDYIILGQHFTNNEYDGYYVGIPCDEEILKQYVNQTIEGMKTGLFSYLAHPDLVNYRDNSEVYKREMSRLCEAALLLNIPLEFNLLGFKEHRHYPYGDFWKIAADAGNSVIIGCDAHTAEDVGNPDIYNSALRILDKYGIKPIKELKIL